MSSIDGIKLIFFYIFFYQAMLIIFVYLRWGWLEGKLFSTVNSKHSWCVGIAEIFTFHHFQHNNWKIQRTPAEQTPSLLSKR